MTTMMGRGSVMTSSFSRLTIASGSCISTDTHEDGLVQDSVS